MRFGRKLQLVPESPRTFDRSDLAKRVYTVRSGGNERGACAKCNRPVVEIDYYGQPLISFNEAAAMDAEMNRHRR